MIYLITTIGVGLACAFGSRSILIGKGFQESETTMYFWLGFFLGVIGLIIAACQPAKNNYGNVAPVATDASELKKYKELLDAGAISEDEFNRKKNEILHL